MAQIDPDFKSAFNDRYNLVSRKLLRAVAENSRSSISDLAKQLNLSRKTTKERLVNLEKELGIRYTIELNEDKLGIINPHLVLVKFRKKPTEEALAKLFEGSRVPQMVATVKGTYDLLVYANASSRQEYVHWDKGMQILLSEYGTLWQPSEVAHRQLGFYPMRNELVENLDIPQKYKVLIKLLNNNSRATFQEMSKQTGMHFNTVAYNFKKLQELDYIKKFTFVMQKPKDVALMSWFGKYVISKTFEEDARNTRNAFKIDEDFSLIGRYVVINQLVGSYDFFGMGAFDSAEIGQRNGIGLYRMRMRNDKPRTPYGVIDKVILGRLPIRSTDTRKDYNTQVWTLDAST